MANRLNSDRFRMQFRDAIGEEYLEAAQDQAACFKRAQVWWLSLEIHEL